MDDTLLHIARAGQPVITVNKRLARLLRSQFDAAMLAAGRTAWPSPRILPLDAWLREQLNALGQDLGVLDDSHAQFLWEAIIEEDLDAGLRPVFQVAATARKARAAHLLLKQYQADCPPEHSAADHRRFLLWRERWQGLAGENGWLERADLPWLVAAGFAGGRLPPPERLVLAGFDDLTPDIKALRQTLISLGCDVSFWTATIIAGARRVKIGCQDRHDEVRCCARWVRRLLLDGAGRIGVVAPGLENYRGLIEPIFQAELDPAGVLEGGDHPGVFSLSLGSPLAAEGVVRAALRILGVRQQVPFDDISWLLRSPYLGGSGDEAAARGSADRVLRECGEVSWPLAQVIRRLRALPGVAQLTRALGALQTVAQDGRKRSAGDWAEGFAALLDQLGWPGPRSLSSREFQAIRQFRELLGRLAGFDRVAGPLHRQAALGQLVRLANETIFQPEAPEGSVQILGLLEAAGMNFDHLWVLGLHESVLPAPPQPNPFLPLPLQRRYGMPHADAGREKLFADRIVQRLFSAAPEVVLSYPQRVDGAEHRPSPYLAGIADGTPALADSVDPTTLLNACRPMLESLVDERARGVPTSRPFSGGTALVKDQALCPFRAFAHHRLKAEQLEVPEVGIDSLSRGTLVHGMLEMFWREVRDQQRLHAMASVDIERILNAAAETALRRLEKHRRRDLPGRIRVLEQARLVRLCAEWLEIEALRPPFTVEEQEKLHQEQVGKLVIRTRIDRIDRLADGRRLIIDYKTGQPDPSRWVGERVTEPQLPVYCLGLAETDLAGVTFAAVRAGDCRFRGLVDAGIELPGLSDRNQRKLLDDMAMTSFADVMRHWQRAVPRLGDAFADGVAVVDPVDAQQACRHCDLVPLCRILERGYGLSGEVTDE